MGNGKPTELIEKEGLLGSTWQNLRSAWREIVRVSKWSDGSGDARPEVLRAQINACLDDTGGEVSARSRAAGLARAYLGFSAADRLAFLELLNRDFTADAEAIGRSVEALRAAEDSLQVERARRQLAQALEPRRVKLLRKFNTLHSGPRFLVELRRELIELKAKHPELDPLERDLKDLLHAWFDIGFLDLRDINWNSPASLLEKLGRYEAVHRVRSWQDLKNRLDTDRRCFAFFHPCMQDEPLIFIEVALVKGLAGQIQELLDEKVRAMEPEDSDTAIFYSISNTQRGLSGISFGDFLIKQVVDRLRREQPNLKRFATLSPIPGFVEWLKAELRAERVSLRPADAKRLISVAGEAPALDALATALDSNRWIRDEDFASALKPILLGLCARYLLLEKRSDGRRALNPVANFHLSNGARMEQLNWMADTSAKGLQESAGIMINYLYRLDRIERYHEDYRSKGRIAASAAVGGLTG